MATGKRKVVELSSKINTHVSVYHVKLTDSALKALEQAFSLQESKCSTADGAKIAFDASESSGIITLPTVSQSSDDSGHVKYRFSMSGFPVDPAGSFDSIKENTFGAKSQMQVVGGMTQRLIVHANEDSYQSTREKMVKEDEKSKKSCAKEIEMGGTFSKHKLKKGLEGLKKPMKVQVKSTGGASSTSAVPQSSSVLIKKPIRERVVHLLALRPYELPELLVKLKYDGVLDAENLKSQVESALKEVGNLKGRKYNLLKTAVSELRLDWPGYHEEDRQKVKRRIESLENQGKPSPIPMARAISPAISPVRNVDSRQYSPPVSVKRPGSQLSNDPSAKKSRLSGPIPDGRKYNQQAKDRNQPQLTEKPVNIHEIESSVLNEVGTPNNKKVHLQNVVEEDIEKKFPSITTEEERAKYKAEFERYYREYKALYNRVNGPNEKVHKLHTHLQLFPRGSNQYEDIKKKIIEVYKTLQKDVDYMEGRKQWEFLHHKLGSIKQKITDFDNKLAT